MTDGMKSTEFWFTVLVVVCATVLRALGDIDTDAWKWAVSLVGGAYVVGRGVVKVVDRTGGVRATRLLNELSDEEPPRAAAKKAR